MSEKRFTTNGYYINDTYHDGVKWLVNEVEAEEIVNVMNGLDTKARESRKALSKLQKENEQLRQHNEHLEIGNKNLMKKNEELRQTIKEMQNDERLYANEILELREANKEFIQFKELGGDY